MKREYSDKQIDFLRTGYAAMGIPALTRAFNRKFGKKKKEGAIKAALKNRKITCGRTTGELRKGSTRILIINAKLQINFLKKNYPFYSQKDLVRKFNKRFNTTLTEQQIISFIHNHNIRCGRTGYFGKGKLPWNTGTKGLTHSNSTSFKKGIIPANTRPLGSERVDTRDGYTLVKIVEPNPYTKAKTRFKHKQVVIWEREHGPVPEGMVVLFKDSDRNNCVEENLELISRAELVRLNQLQYRQAHPEIKPALLTLAKLKTKLFKTGRKNYAEKNRERKENPRR